MESFDAIIVGSGPNGLAAAITLAQAGFSVRVYDAEWTAGGGTKTEELTLPGFHHDTFSAVHPMAASAFFSKLDLATHGLDWITPPIQAAHPFKDGTEVSLFHSVDQTADNLGRDGRHYRALMEPLVREWPNLFDETFQPVLHFPRHPFLLAKFGLNALWPAEQFAKMSFKEDRTRALFLGIAAHANTPLQSGGTAAIGLMLALAGHAKGWRFPKGGSGQISKALVSYFQSLGGEIKLGERITNLDQLPKSKCILFDMSPRRLAQLLKDLIPNSYRSRLEKIKYGPGVFKVDWALAGPIPWRARACAQAATVHLVGSSAEAAASERLPARGQVSEKPYVLLTQPSLFDSGRAPMGKHTAWAYCHVPNASAIDMTDAIENQIERFAPGFRDLILARHKMGPKDLENKNANLIGGDISGGAIGLGSLLFRPLVQWDPYQLPVPGYFLCSSATPPGARSTLIIALDSITFKTA
jgi:phytoene dehydrogenase-like protein